MASKTCENDIITKAECASIVCKALNSKNVNLIDYHVKYASEDAIGFLGEYFYLTATVENNTKQEQLTLFIKSLPINQAQLREHLEDCGIFKKEVVLYKTVLKDIYKYNTIKWRPDCYMTRDDIIVLEDLSSKGYQHVPDDMDFNYSHIASTLESLSAMHASSISYEVETNSNIANQFHDCLFETSISSDINWYHVGLKAVRTLASVHPKFQSEKYQNFIKNILLQKLEPVYELVNTSKKYLNVLCHRDVWGKNLLFKFENNDPTKAISNILIDYQICRYCPPAIDVIMCLYLNTNRIEREKIYDKSIKLYYENLKRMMNILKLDVNNFVSFEEILETCTYSRLFGILYKCIAFTITKLPKGLLQNMKRNNPEQFDIYTNHDRTEVLLENIKKNENFRLCMFEIIEDLMELVYEE